MATYLVTGGCGFIGSHLVDALCSRGHVVRIVDDLSVGKIGYKPAQAELIRGDVVEPRIVAEAMEGIAGCFHLAAVASVERGNTEWVRTHRTNLTGAIAVFDTAWRINPGRPIPVVYASSAAVYGDNRSVPLREDDRPRPLSAYGADKFGCELHALVASRLHRVPTRGLRFFNVYGPRQDPNSPYSGVISIFCDRLRAGRAITINGDGRQRRDFIHVSDVVHALLAAMDNCSVAGDILNVCTGQATSIRDLAELAGDILGVEPELRVAPPRKGDIRSSVGDPTKARRTIGFTAATGLEAGLRPILRADFETVPVGGGAPARAA